MVVAETAALAADAAERVRVEWEPLPAVTATRDAVGAGRAGALGRARGQRVRRLAGRRRARGRRRLRGRRPRGAARHLGAAHHRGADGAARGARRPRRGDRALHPLRGLGRLGASQERSRRGARGARGQRCAWSPRTWVATTAPATAPTPSTRWWPGRPAGSAGRSSGRATGARCSSPTTRRAIWSRPWSWPSTRTGTFLALRGTNTSNVGAHAVTFVPLNKGRELSTTVYRLPVAAVRGRAVHSNTSPLSAYRSAGRPQVMFVMERLIDLAARRHGFDRVALRRRNLVPPGAMPYTNPFGIVYDSGDYPAAQDRVLALADWAGFEARRAEARRRGTLPRHRPRQLHRDRHRRAARAGAGHRAAGRLHRRGHRHALGGPGPRDRLRPAHRGMARRRALARAPDRGRHRPGRGRRRLALRPLHAPGRGGDGQGLRPARGAGRPARGVAARVRGGGRGVRASGASASAGPTARWISSRSRPPRSGTTRRPTCAARSRASATRR